jgi:hypothetical protein
LRSKEPPPTTDSDTLCRTKVLQRGFHAHRRSLHRTRECSETKPPCQSRSRCTPVRAHNAHEPRAPSIGLTQRLAASGSPRKWDESFHATRLGHLLHNLLHAALSGGWHAAWLLLRAPGASMPALHPRRRCLSPISAVDLLSREFVKPPSSRAWSLRSSNLRDLPRTSDSARLYRTRHEPST